MKALIEGWRSIEGYEGSYEVSSLGRIRCLSRYVRRLGRNAEIHLIYRGAKILTPKKRGSYLSVVLHSEKLGKKNISIHRVVAEAFLHNPQELPQVNHLDGNKHNNAMSNLEWCTGSYNQSYSRSIWHDYVSPGGSLVSVQNHKRFCKENGLSVCGLWRLRKGLQKQHKGWSLPCVGH